MKMDYKLGYLWIALLIAVLVLPLSAGAMEMEDCLGCHSDMDMVDEELFVNAEIFAHTAHAEMGCVSCHESVTDEHPDDGEAVSNAACLDCHDDVAEQYMATAHAENATCGDCHNPHQVHGLGAVSQLDMNLSCSQCHDNNETVKSHSGWLPQADLHIAKLACITCHSSAEGFDVVVTIVQKQDSATFGSYKFSSYADLKEISGENEIQSLIDTNADNLISVSELRAFNLNPIYGNMHLEGTLVPSESSHNLSTQDNRRDCTYCHASSPESMQTSFLALPTENGTYQRMEIESGAVLDALFATPDFYLTGSTRSMAMSIIGLLIVCGGFVLPVGHGSLRFLTRKNRKH